ncbi:uncharacterized protein PSFLO_02433 [Pseudozyma flocculosa]|uniref:Uncharacterized protein n=1 Tax=Pseudozyma flocculosa TaxID=84751 RepID=A0A5C3F107_9BASI|nr:uncharacterized protein PSFLO_02433 [Pseudozyma flocculosa]
MRAARLEAAPDSADVANRARSLEPRPSGPGGLTGKSQGQPPLTALALFRFGSVVQLQPTAHTASKPPTGSLSGAITCLAEVPSLFPTAAFRPQTRPRFVAAAAAAASLPALLSRAEHLVSPSACPSSVTANAVRSAPTLRGRHSEQ